MILSILSCKDVLFSSQVFPASCALSTASSIECLYAEKALTAAATPAAIRISGFARSVDINPDSAELRETVALVATPSALANPIDATAALAWASVIPCPINTATLCASDKAVLDSTSFVWDSESPFVRLIRLAILEVSNVPALSAAFTNFRALDRFENSFVALVAMLTNWLRAYVAPAVPSPAKAPLRSPVFSVKSTTALEPSRNPAYKSREITLDDKDSREAFKELVFASSPCKYKSNFCSPLPSELAATSVYFCTRS